MFLNLEDYMEKHIPLILFCLYAVKLLVLPLVLADVGVLLVLGAFAFADKFKLEIGKYTKRIDDYEKQLEVVKNLLIQREKEFADLKTHFSGLRLAAQAKGLNVNR